MISDRVIRSGLNNTEYVILNFCSHLHYTEHIGDFVIASEEAIAKGIRRIVALTGPEATKAQKKAAVLQSHLEQLEATIAADKSGANAKDHVKKIVELTDDVSRATIPSWKKVRTFRNFHNFRNITS